MEGTILAKRGAITDDAMAHWLRGYLIDAGQAEMHLPQRHVLADESDIADLVPEALGAPRSVSAAPTL